jgi:hypothetical protein
MAIEPTPEYVQAIVALNRVTRREKLLRIATGHPKWRTVADFLFCAGFGWSVAWGWKTAPWILVAIPMFLIYAASSITSRRLDAVVKLLEEAETGRG